MYYIEKVDKLGVKEKLFKSIKIEDNKILVPINTIQNLNEKQLIKLANKTSKMLQKTHSQKIVLSKDFYENEIYKNILYSYGYDIVDGKWLFEGIEYKVLDYIVDKKQIRKEETKISILVNDLTDYTLENIKRFSKEYKTLNIVTNHIEKFKNIEDKIYEKEGIMITVTNNKKKSLLKSNIILNIDFPNELINKYNIFDETIIVNINRKVKINKKRFNGIVINDYEISVKNNVITNYIGNYERYYLKHLYEAEFYKNISYKDFQNKINDDELQLQGLYGLNGKIL